MRQDQDGITEPVKSTLTCPITSVIHREKGRNFGQFSLTLVPKPIYFYESTTSVLDDPVCRYAYSHFVIARGPFTAGRSCNPWI